MTNAVQALVSAVQDNTSAVNAAVSAIQAGSSGVDPTDAPAITAVVSQIMANTSALNAAVGGTPPIPAPTGAPQTAAQKQAALNVK